MKVVYKKSIFNKIGDEIAKAEKEGEKIEKIILNLEEWKEFCSSPPYNSSSFLGIPIEPEKCDYNEGLKISYPYF
ncbi:MAG: hypothetical protein ACOCRX_07200 [Candidatus Woesearchaeota archaeon]